MARALAGWLCGGLLASWLGRALAIWLSGWLPTWLSGWLAIWLAGWLAIWLAAWLAGWGWLAKLAGWLASWLAGWLSGWLVGYLARYLAIWLAGWAVACSLKLRIGWEIHVCAVSVSKKPKKTNFFGELSRRHVSFPRILFLIMVSHPSRRGSNFCRFLASDIEKIRIFWESTLCEKITFFRTELAQNKIQKKVTFLGNFPGCIFHHVSFSWLCFYTVLSGWSTTSGWASEKAFFRTPKNVRKNDFFSRETIRCFLAPALALRKRIPYLSANRLEPIESAEISTSKLAKPKQQMSKSMQQFLKCTLISSPLVRWKWPTQVGTLGALCWGCESLEWCNPRLPQIFGASEKMLFFRATAPGWLSEKILVVWLAGWLSGWLGWLSSYLAGWLAI